MEKDEETLQEEINPEVNSEELHTDPLDEVFDEDTLRAEAKKYRSIAQRKAKEKAEVKETPKEEPPKEEPKGDYLKKSDFELANQKKATKLVTTVSEGDTEEAKATKADMLANWESIKALYVPRRGKDTPEDVMEDIKDAYVLFNARRPKEEINTVADLSSTKVIPGTVAPKGQQPAVKNPPNFKLGTQPKDWYKKS